MILLRAFFLIIISFLIFVGAQARPLLGNHHGSMLMLMKLKLESRNYGRLPYITPASSPPTNQEIVNGRHDHVLPPPSPKHDPVIGQLTTSTTPDHDAAPLVTVGGRHDHIPVPPPPEPQDEQRQIIITSSSNLPLQASY